MSTAAGGAYNFKVVLLGEGCVGKTSLLQRYIEDKFNNKHITTLQATFLNKKINIDGKRINLSIWDTAGQEKFHALGPIYYRNSNGAILVYDITDEDSFMKVKSWVKELKRMLGSDVVIFIVGNKVDLDHERVVPLDEAESYAALVGAKHCGTSAKMNVGVDNLFLELTQDMVKAHTEGAQNPGTRSSQVLVVDDDEPNPGNCCYGVKNTTLM